MTVPLLSTHLDSALALYRQRCQQQQAALVDAQVMARQYSGLGLAVRNDSPDSNNAPGGEASAAVRRLTPYASPSDALPAGWHLPLHDDNEVLVSCLNNDPDRPMLVGTLANPARRSVVTAENAHQNRLLTAGGNDLTMDDWRDKSAISLCTFAGHTMLHLNADVLGHRVNLASALGQMEWYAKKTIATHSGDTLTETVGNNRLQQIENRHGTTTNKKEVHHQANTDGDISAANHIQMESGQNTELTAGRDMRLDITKSTRIQVRDQDAVIHIDSGSLTVQAEQAITIEGDGKGEIVFEQSGGGFRMAPNGDITLFGDEISFSADAINFYGLVSKEVTAPDGMPAATVTESLKPQPIDKLTDPAPPPGNFRLRVVEYLCWDAYDEEAQLFHPGDKHNKPIPDKKFRVRLPDDNVVERTTDSAGEIELSAKNELKNLDHFAGEFHVLFEPEEAKLNDSYALFDELKRPLEKVPNSKDPNHG